MILLLKKKRNNLLIKTNNVRLITPQSAKSIWRHSLENEHQLLKMSTSSTFRLILEAGIWWCIRKCRAYPAGSRRFRAIFPGNLRQSGRIRSKKDFPQTDGKIVWGFPSFPRRRK